LVRIEEFSGRKVSSETGLMSDIAILRQLTFHGSNGCLPSIEFLDGLPLQSIELGVSYESDIPSSSGTVPLFQ
jgi:hypothetical protein